jgi:hypothetical protein
MPAITAKLMHSRVLASNPGMHPSPISSLFCLLRGMVDASKESVNRNLNSRYRLRCSDLFHNVRATEKLLRAFRHVKRGSISEMVEQENGSVAGPQGR